MLYLMILKRAIPVQDSSTDSSVAGNVLEAPQVFGAVCIYDRDICLILFVT